MIYKIIIGKNEIRIDDEDKVKIMQNVDKNFIVLKNGAIINPSFIQAIVVDHEAGRNEVIEPKRHVEIIDGKPTLFLD